ncbi:LLM class flavin-dependent oxidoreductase [Corynebacterium ulcerans]|uniref:LLM class flavin-dependent oxidoreductase n=1 Tax=Corynebacterium ulcerans TaxID=65058 RepID=UPI0018D63E77|nr:LLM class flavin-dependent oxidoreductase [Corynebacterium ulcerans]MBH5297905.1 LLM class flavin-dependent oxidoreductase [Corynebacterium ulcerans]MBH5303423.1 LLM class flavin-dependent oxidoreductase [Corynebacterium ulcerans]
MKTPVPLSILDFATIPRGETARKSFTRSVQLARAAERLGFSRIWYAEHHNVPTIASSAPAILIAHVANHTDRIRLGAGGIMLPNHSPYVVAEQFGTLAELHPGRIDLGLGRAPGTDQNTVGKALRRSPHAANSFPHDVAELQGYLSDQSPIPGIRAIPGAGTQVPLYILGSSLFGARLAAEMGFPYAFASHFAPKYLDEAIRTYRGEFRPSAHLDKPYVIAGVNVTWAETMQKAHEEFDEVFRSTLRSISSRGESLSDSQLDALANTHAGDNVREMLRFSAIGTTQTVTDYLQRFVARANADELMLLFRASSWDNQLRAVEELGNTWT